MASGAVSMYRHPHTSLCRDFIDQAVTTWNRIRYGETTGIRIYEDTITDLNLLELQATHPHEIVTRKSPRWMESKIGADWEWWLHSSGVWIGLRVQAKKIDGRNLRYRWLDSRSRHGRQVDLLIDRSLNNTPPMIPIYILYNYWNLNRFDPPWLCCNFSKSVEMLGCSISHALTIKQMLDRQSIALKDISTIMYPWSCLVCCRRFSSRDLRLPLRTLDFLVEGFKEHISEEDFESLPKRRFLLKEAPSYVYAIMERMKLRREEWERIGVNRIVVISEIQKDESLVKD